MCLEYHIATITNTSLLHLEFSTSCAGMDTRPYPRVGRSGRRSKDGCMTCRTRKLKCDEIRPLCGRCVQSKFSCEWGKATPGGRRRRQKHGKDKVSNETTILAPQSSTAEPTSPGTIQSATATLRNNNYLDVRSHGPASVKTPANEDLCLQPALSTKHIPLANAFLLEAEDWHYFQYIPNSILVLQFGKPWQWSMLSYVHTKIASHHQSVMRAFIAVACMELDCRGLAGFNQSLTNLHASDKAVRLRTLAMRHYHRSLRDLSALLSSISQSYPEDQDADTVFSLWLLILQFSLHDADLTEASHVHLSGIHSFLLNYFQGRDGKGRRSLPPASQQLLHFISFVLATGRNLKSWLTINGRYLMSTSPLVNPAVVNFLQK